MRAASILQAQLGSSCSCDRQQLSAVLAYCDGLPLALTVIGGFLADDATRAGVLQDIQCSLNNKKAVGVGDVHDELVGRLCTSVNLLQPELRSTWLDIAMLFSDGSVSWQISGGGVWSAADEQPAAAQPRQQESVDRTIKVSDYMPPSLPQVHHVLLTVANEICQPGTC